MTIGDVQAVLAFIIALALTLWATILSGVFLFGDSARRAEQAIATRSGATIGTGFLVFLLSVPLAIFMVSKSGLVQLLGFAAILVIAAIACIGSSGIALMVAGKMQQQDPKMSRFTAILRGTALLVATGFTPILGWFFAYPVLVIASVGAGLQGVFGKVAPTQPISTPAPFDLQ